MLGNWLSCRPLNRQQKIQKNWLCCTVCTQYIVYSVLYTLVFCVADHGICIIWYWYTVHTVQYSKILIQDLLWILHTSHFHLGSPKRVYTIKVPSMDFVLFGFFNGFVWSGSVCINWTRNTAHGDNFTNLCKEVWWSMGSVPASGPPGPGSYLELGPPHSVVWGAADHTVILYK